MGFGESSGAPGQEAENDHRGRIHRKSSKLGWNPVQKVVLEGSGAPGEEADKGPLGPDPQQMVQTGLESRRKGNSGGVLGNLTRKLKMAKSAHPVPGVQVQVLDLHGTVQRTLCTDIPWTLYPDVQRTLCTVPRTHVQRTLCTCSHNKKI